VNEDIHTTNTGYCGTQCRILEQGFFALGPAPMHVQKIRERSCSEYRRY